MLKKITDSIIYVGANDHELDLFEGQYAVPNGMAYNSYVILDDKTAVLDTIEQKKTAEWLANVEEALGGRTLDYLIVQHMEPDHSASIQSLIEKYPDTTVVGNKKTFQMIEQFFPGLVLAHTLVVEDGETLALGNYTLTFLFAPMVHWPEVMMVYESFDKVLFSADAFGKFGALDVEEDWACEARRYYIGIVGKYGAQVQRVLKRAESLEIDKICPLHGPVLDKDLDYYFNLYDLWSGYRSETEGVCICYTSVYGNTKKAVELLAQELSKLGVENVVVNDLARCDMAEAVEDAFRYDRLVLATTTYNSDIFPFMKQFIDHLTERNFQNRTVAFIENGSWAPAAMKKMQKYLAEAKELTMLENNVTIKSALNEDSTKQVMALAAELAAQAAGKGVDGKVAGASEKGAGEGGTSENASGADSKATSPKGFVCNICGYVFEGDVLPDGFTCPLCGRGAEDFSPVE